MTGSREPERCRAVNVDGAVGGTAAASVEMLRALSPACSRCAASLRPVRSSWKTSPRGTSPYPEPFARAQTRDSVITLTVGHPLALVEAIDVQRTVEGADRPAPHRDRPRPGRAHAHRRDGHAHAAFLAPTPPRKGWPSSGQPITSVARPPGSARRPQPHLSYGTAPTAPTEDGCDGEQPTHSTCFFSAGAKQPGAGGASLQLRHPSRDAARRSSGLAVPSPRDMTVPGRISEPGVRCCGAMNGASWTRHARTARARRL